MEYKKSKLVQGSVQWLDKRIKRIGASEGYAILRHYATDVELLAVGWQPEDVRTETPCVGELPYTSAYAIYNRIVNNVFVPSINIWDDMFGKAVEAWVKSTYKVAPKNSVYINKLRICSLDAEGGFGSTLGIPDNAVVEIKSRRSQVEDKVKKTWLLQNTIQCAAAHNNNGVIVQITLADNSENMRGAVAKMFDMLPRKKFFEWFDGLEKRVHIIPNPFNERLYALYEICEARFWEDVRLGRAPVPVIDEEPNRKCVNELLGSYTGTGIYMYSFDEYTKLKSKIETDQQRLMEMRQQYFVSCLQQRVIQLVDKDGKIAKWTRAGGLSIKGGSGAKSL